MRNKVYFLLLIAGFLQIISCKKDSRQPVPQQNTSLEASLVNFSIDGELLNAAIDTETNVISVVVPRTSDQHSLKVSLTLANQVNATINNIAITNGSTIDFSKSVHLTLASTDKKQSVMFQVNVQTDLQYFGVTGSVVAEKSLNKDYNFYFDQFDGSEFQSINCGPAVTTMALKWADSTSVSKPADARGVYPEHGGYWYTSDVQNYLFSKGINSIIDTLDNLDNVVKTNINNNNLLILCLDMHYPPYNNILYQHTDKFYRTDEPIWGHFLLVKGYKQTTTNFYLEIYDPYSDTATYSVITKGQLKGLDRYYSSAGIKVATDVWWPYTIVVAPKGQQVITSTKLRVNSIHKPVPVAYGR
jgi:hypothetical protein